EPACASGKLQFTYSRVTDSSRTWSTSGRPITCTMDGDYRRLQCLYSGRGNLRQMIRQIALSISRVYC
ncbi:hypothetical protein PENTCL1PPCAC_15669, partial [Pristionchus entomophagus]